MSLNIHLDEGVSCESNYSPGVIKDSEYLIRDMCNPEFFDETGITDAAISLDDLRSNGVSVHRREHTTAGFVKQALQVRCKDRQDWKMDNVSLVKVKSIREIRDGKKQLFRVIDTATKDNPAHADIFPSILKDRTLNKGDARLLRRLLLPLLKESMSVDVAFQIS